MLKMNLIGKSMLFGTLFGASFGCNESGPATTRNESEADRTTTVTSGKPVIPEFRGTMTPENNDDREASKSDPRTNTEINVRDRDNVTKTPFDQNENKTDIGITANIRSRVVDTEMSIDAQNVKIITQDGKVTLRGPVHTAGEKMQVEQIAIDVAGKDNVDSQLEIAAN